jgi:hypothetical protein
MTTGTKTTLKILGIIFAIAGISCFAFGSAIDLPAYPVFAALMTFAGFIMLVLGFKKEEEFGAANPSEASKATKKAA